jgi:hypothetical protein
MVSRESGDVDPLDQLDHIARRRPSNSNVLLCFDDETVLILLGELSRGADDLIDEPGQ